MRQIVLTGHGRPDQVVRCENVDDPADPTGNEVTVAIRAAAINPADLLIFEGRYPGPTELPAPVGIEGAGEVIAVGPDVDGLKVGDKVMSLGRANWAEVVPHDALLEAGSLAACRQQGALRLEGKTYPVQDGEVVHFRFNV